MSRSTPGCLLIGSGCLIQAIGIVAFIFLVLNGVLKQPGTRYVVPGTHSMVLSEPADYTIFYEYKSVVNGTTYATPQALSGLSVTVTAPDGSNVPLRASSGTYTNGSTAGDALFDFRVSQPGTYTLTSAYAAGQRGPNVVLNVVKGFIEGLLGLIGGGFLLLFSTLFAGIVLMVWGIVLLVLHNRRAPA